MRLLRLHIVVFLLTIGIVTGVSGQCQFYLKDGQSGLPVGDAFVEIVLDDGTSAFYTSDNNGRIAFNQDIRVRWIAVSHLNYQVFQLNIKDICDQQLILTSATHDLDAVVITGQHMPQSLSRSVVRVNSISKTEIRESAARTLTDVLLFEKGIRIDRDPAIGSSSLKLGGVGGNNVKVLLNGVPIPGRAGFGFDLDQLNIGDFESIEIVEGPMSVEYGSHALGGVINLITPVGIRKGLGLEAAIHEETAGNQYGISEGTHNYNVSASAGLSKSMALTAGIARRYFGGAQLELSGRAREWDPKTQWTGLTQWDARFGHWKLHYRADLMDEMIKNLGAPAGIDPPIAIDDQYHANRLSQQFRFGRSMKRSGSIDGHVSVNLYKRIKNSFVTNLNTGIKQLATSADAQDSSYLQSYHSRLQANKWIGNAFSLQGGVDLQFDRVKGGRVSGNSFREAFDAGFYVTAEWKPIAQLTLRPGIRTGYHSLYRSPFVPSLHIKYALSDAWGLRAGYGHGFRAPELRELYFDFFDATHQIRGNPDLEAETSDYLEGSATWLREAGGATWRVEIRAYYHDINNRIDFVQSATDPNITTLDNIARLQSTSNAIEFNVRKTQFNASTAFSIEGTGIQVISFDKKIRWSWTPVINSGFQFSFRTLPLSARINWRWQGRTPVFQYNEETNVIDRLQQESYMFSDLVAHWRATQNMKIAAGVRNLFDVSKIKTAGRVGGIHSGGEAQYLAYGRSFFLTLNYNLSKNKNVIEK